MKLLSEKSAIKHYENLYIIHNLNLTRALKVCIFWHILEHEILKEATKLQKYYDRPGQLDWLKKNKESLDRNGEKVGNGFIPREIVLDIENIRGYRNLAEHTGEMDDINYKKHFRTMAVTINLLSEIQIPENIDNILKRIITIKIKKSEETNIKKVLGNKKIIVKVKTKSRPEIQISDEILNKTINYKGKNIYFKKNNHELFQDFVRRIINFMFNNSLLSKDEIEALQDKEYSTENFGISFPLLVDDINKTKDANDYSRYWRSIKFGGKYYCCSQWQLGNTKKYEPLFAKWMNKIFKNNKIC